ncbi:MAG: outer membrane protein assembly factor BamE [bacterium]
MVLSLSACYDGIFPDASTHNFYSSQLNKTAVGKTTARDIRKTFGKPVSQKTGNAGKTTWIYTYERIAPEYMISDFKKLTVVFDEKMVVRDFTFEERNRGESFITGKKNNRKLLGHKLLTIKK